MNKEFIPYQQALDLESIGFDIRPDFGNQTSLYGREGRHIFYVNYGVMGSGLDDGYIYAPTFSQAFRWFREKHNLDSFVKHLYKSTIKVGYYFGIDQYKGIEFQMGLDDCYKTYEESELACLMKLIEIVKNK